MNDTAVEKRQYEAGPAMRLTGQMLSMGVTMVIFGLSIGSARLTPEHHPHFLTSMRTAFILFSALCFRGLFTALARGKVR